MRILCLANSFRVGGRCLGGIELDMDNNPVIVNGRPKWVRPIINTQQEEVPTNLVGHIYLLDIIEFKQIGEVGHGHQTENVLFEPNTLSIVGQQDWHSLDKFIDNSRFSLVFGNRGAAVPEHLIASHNYSLKLLSLTEFEINERRFPGKVQPQIKLSFKYNGNLYNFPITDPVFLHRKGLNNNLLLNKEKIYVCLSLAAPHEEWSSKLVAGIMYEGSRKPKKEVVFEDNDMPF